MATILNYIAACIEEKYNATLIIDTFSLYNSIE